MIRVMHIRVLAAFVLAVVIVGPVAGADSCWVLSQTSMLRGKETLTVSANALRHEYNDIVTVATAPKWSVIVFNKKTKKVFDTGGKVIANNSGINNELMVGEYFTKLPMRADKPQKLTGVNANHYIMRSGKKPISQAAYESRNVKKWVADTIILNADMWTLGDFQPSEPVQKLLVEIYKLPKVSGVPMKMVYVDIGGREVKELLTDKVEKVSVTATTFSVPAGYAKAQNLSEVASVRSKKQMDGVAELFGNWRDSVSGK